MPFQDGRYDARDRLWLGVNSVQLISLAEPLDLDGLRARVRALAEQDPGLAYFRRPGAAADRYRQAADGPTAASVLPEVRVLDAGSGPGTPLEAAMSAVMTADEGTPVAEVFAFDDLVGHKFPHVFGDGLSAATHLRRLGTGPEPGSALPFPIPGLTHPVERAMRSRYLASGALKAPGLVRRDLDLERFAPPAEATGPDDVAWNPAAGTGDRAAENTVQVVIRQLDPEGGAALKAWRKQHGAGASAASVQLAAIRRGLADAGVIPAEDGMFVVYDLRHTLHPAPVGGNFISVPYLKPTSSLDPVAINTAMKAANASGLPLVQLARGTAKAALSRNHDLPRMRQPANRRDVSFSHMRVEGMLPTSVVGRPDGTAQIVAAAMPPNVGSLSFQIVEHGPYVTVTAVFCSPFTPREGVEEALTRFAKDPVALLS
ncbi:hypothetical protein ACIB24_12360 [Spongisporangium articulatum]|uniref:Uncharacterized protein n=1 Tax=Spongisporangium articulatum TaxID=3362603 RepID=A0ABW8APE0_9ACTN